MTALPHEPHIGLVVEGLGDLHALPILLRLHLSSRDEYRDILGKPVPAHGRGRATTRGGLEGLVATAARTGCRGILVVLDGEGACVAQLGPDLYTRTQGACGVPVEVALADRDFEDWLYASAETLDIGLSAYAPGTRGQLAIKEALKPGSYTKPVDQPKLAARVDPALAARRSPSLARMLRKLDDLCRLVPEGSR